ncbi:hypothetical protein [Streptomyces longispororuber]|uniref:hypothetical protein n=1 Tax=Streptomyces longispororuber TaxID=68230 RepID=UPI00210F1315|nr:hypothetical protein [Streptomyces longispororuber]MCQ4205746.1 hypothetical protein [Streptomyces longispororuber]
MLNEREAGEIAKLLEEMAVDHPDPELNRSATRMAKLLRHRIADTTTRRGIRENGDADADERDRAADARDREAEARDVQARQRDDDAAWLDRQAEVGAQRLDELILAAAGRQLAADLWTARTSWGVVDAGALREQAHVDRELAATDRAEFRAALNEAQVSRKAAMQDRYAADGDRRAARRDRTLSQADRSAAAEDRSGAAEDRGGAGSCPS